MVGAIEWQLWPPFRPDPTKRSIMKFPSFPDPKLVGLTACGYLVSPTEEILRKLENLHQRRPFVTYRAKKGSVHAHVLGGRASSPHHLHVDLFKSELLKADKVKPPTDNSTRQDLSNDLDIFNGVRVRVSYTGIFLIKRSKVPSGMLIHPIRYEAEDSKDQYIEMTSATFRMVGIGIKRLEWRLASEDRFRIELSYSEETVISNNYLTAPIEILSEYFEIYALGEQTDASSGE